MTRFILALLTAIMPSISSATQPVAERILDSCDARGGLVVHLGCGDGKLTAALGAGDSYLVHGLSTNVEQVAGARETIQSLGLYGKVSVDAFDGEHLPHASNLVNLLVVSDSSSVDRDEMLRVLTPGGAAVTLDATHSPLDHFHKPWPAEMDDWTHFLHGADGNAVSTDRQVGNPECLRWIADPKFSRHHDEVLGTSAMVTGGGRIFSIVDEAPRSTLHPAIGGKFFLIARDAFNGLVLWKKPIEDWGWKSWGNRQNVRFSQPIQLPKRIVVGGDKLYVTLGWNAPVSVLAAQTGALIQVLSETDYADEMLLCDGMLIVSVYDKPVRPLEALAEQTKRIGNSPRTLKKRIQAVDLESGQKLWETDWLEGLTARFDAVSAQTHLELTVRSGRVFAITKDSILCFALRDGTQQWVKPRPDHPVHRMNLGVNMSDNCTVLADDERLYVAQPVGRLTNNFHTIPCDLYAYDAHSGEQVWMLPSKIGSFAWGIHADVFLIDGKLWSHEHLAAEMKGAYPLGQDSIPYALLAINAKTGTIEKRIDTRTIFNVTHHHRCYRNNATERFVLSARRGTELTDLDSGELFVNHWLRGECRFGMVPANGLLYAPPDPCSCHARIKVNGMLALAAKKTTAKNTAAPDKSSRVVKGPAFGNVPAIPCGTTDWPMHRRNPRRQGYAKTTIEMLSSAWKIDLGDTITQAIGVGDHVFVSCQDTHRVVALDLGDGRRLWDFTASGRIDSPPTLCNGYLLFGSSDGHVYCLRAGDGHLAWKFRAAPMARLIMDCGQLESAWPVHGSVLVHEDLVYVVAGRSSYLDGGLYAFALDVATGEIRKQRRISSSHSDKPLEFSEQTFDAEGALNQLLVSDGRTVYLQSKPLFDAESATAPANPFLMATCGMLDGSMFNRFGWSFVGASGATGTQIVHDDNRLYASCATVNFGRSSTFVVGTGYPLFEASLPSQPDTFAQFEKNAFASLGYRGPKVKSNWRCKMPIRGQAMLLTSNALLVAGFPDEISEDDPYATFEGRSGSKLLRINRETGKTIEELTLTAPPAWDGISCVAGRVLVALENGRLVCLRTDK